MRDINDQLRILLLELFNEQIIPRIPDIFIATVIATTPSLTVCRQGDTSGTNIEALPVDSYTSPTINDVVKVSKVGNTFIVDGKIA